MASKAASGLKSFGAAIFVYGESGICSSLVADILIRIYDSVNKLR